ncbi:MAG: DNA polymerase III subunit delta [Clostridia bacterium]|nr:DNA polymerase III subunit delta [Clostridia bacterium]
MKYSELKRSLVNGVQLVYVLHGTDDFLRNYAVQLIREKCISMPDLNYLAVEGGSLTPEMNETVFNSLRSYPFLSDRRMVLLKEYYPTADEYKKSGMAEYMSSPEATSVLIINNKKSHKVFDKADKATFVDCTSDMPLCVGWICNEAKKAALGISPVTATRIAEYCLLDFTKISTEMKKLVDYCAEEGEISLAAVNEIVHKDSEYQIYEMVERISSGRAEEAYFILNDLLSKNESEQRIFISIYSHFRRLLHVAVSPELKNSELAETLGVKEYAIKMTRMQVKKFSVKKLKGICEKFSEYDVRLKSGDMGLGDALWNGVFSAMIGV